MIALKESVVTNVKLVSKAIGRIVLSSIASKHSGSSNEIKLPDVVNKCGQAIIDKQL